MARYRKKPIVIEAFQHDGSKESFAAIARLGNHIEILPTEADGTFSITVKTLEGVMTANPFDWIVIGVMGEIYPVRDDIFVLTYELDC